MNKEILNKFSNFLVKVIAVIFMVLMGINSLLVLTKTAIFPKDYQETLYYENDSAILNIIFLIIFSIVILILARYLKKIISVQRLVLVVMIYTFIISILFAILRRDYVQFDPFNVIDQANNFIRENYSGLDKGNNYLYIYSHQITTVFLFQIILSLFGRATFILYIMQSFSISYIIFMLYKISNIMFEDEDTNYLVVILSGLCFPLVFYVAFVYGLLPGMFLTLVAYYYFIKYIKCKKWYTLVISALSINIAILFIGNNLIHMLAIFSAAVIYLIRVRDKKVIAFIVSSLFLMSASKSMIYNYYEVKSQKTIADGVPKITWIAMGMQEGDREAGWWNRFNYDIMPEEDYDAKRITDISKDSIKQRVEVFKKKQIYFDGTHDVISFIMKVFQVFVYVFSVVFAVNVYKKKKEILTIIPVAFIGGTLFHMIWEAKSRYVFPYFVFLIPLAAYGLIIVQNKITEYKKNKEDKDEKGNI